MENGIYIRSDAFDSIHWFYFLQKSGSVPTSLSEQHIRGGGGGVVLEKKEKEEKKSLYTK